MTIRNPRRAEHRALWPEAVDEMLASARVARVRFLLTGGLVASIASQMSPAAYAQTVSDRYLSSVTAQENGACATVNIEFNVPIRYTSHFPDRSGRELRIGVQPLNFNRSSLSTALAAESVRPPASAVAGIQRITYDVSDPAGPTLVIQFDHDATWQVEADKRITRLVVTVSNGKGCQPGAASRGANPILSVTQTLPDKLDASGNYAINLSSNRGKEIDPAAIKQLQAFRDYAAYAYAVEENGTQWARLRLGMFQTRAEAENVLATILGDYPDAWIARIDRTERETVYQAWLAARGEAAAQAGPLPVNPEADALLKQLRDTLSAGDNASAIKLAERILGMPENAASPDAQELLGLARERNGQLAHAKAEYETFLQRYPTHEGAERVRQRLSALLGEEPAPPPKEKGVTVKGATKGAGDVRGEASGSLSVLYQRDESGFIFENVPIVGGPEVNPDPIEENRVNLNEVLYGADVNLSLGNDRVEGVFRFSGIYRDDLRAGLPRDEGAISTLYLDVSDREWNTSMRLGRQTRNTGGVFGRFDGGLLSFQATDSIKLNLVAGFPVQSSRDLEIKSDRVFYGGSVDLSVVPDALDTTFYYIDQTYGGLIDRQAAGFEFRYFDTHRSAYGIYDYDVHFNQVNLALLNASTQLDDDSSISLAIDYRRSPLLATQNAIIGQGVLDPNDLLLTHTEDEIYQFAQDRSAYARSASVSYSRTLMKNLQFNADIIATNVSGTKTSGGVDAQPGTGTEYYYSGQLVASDVFSEGAIFIAGLRYADLQLIDQYTVQLNGRYPLMQDLRLNTKLRLDQRQRKDGSSDEVSARGSLALTYNMGRMTHFDFEIGGQYSDNSNPLVVTKEQGVFGSFGIRQDF